MMNFETGIEAAPHLSCIECKRASAEFLERYKNVKAVRRIVAWVGRPAK